MKTLRVFPKGTRKMSRISRNTISSEMPGVLSQWRISCRPRKYQGPFTVGLRPSWSGAVRKNANRAVMTMVTVNSIHFGHTFLTCSKMTMARNIVNVAI